MPSQSSVLVLGESPCGSPPVAMREVVIPNPTPVILFSFISETSASAIYFGGASTASQAIGNTEFWNVTSWTEVADLGTGRKFLTGSVNSPVAGVIGAAGYQPSSPYTRNITEEWTASLSNKTITSS